MKLLNSNRIKTISYAALCLALALALPFLTGQIPGIGKALSPMHIPAFLCGFICGPVWGLIVGAISPLLRYAIFKMPMLVSAVPMTFELAAYGLSTGILYRLLPKKIPFIYITLISSMVIGRIVKLIFTLVSRDSFVLADFIYGSVSSTLPGIICHLILVPAIVIALKKSKLLVSNV